MKPRSSKTVLEKIEYFFIINRLMKSVLAVGM
jgi:hypothetical protein